MSTLRRAVEDYIALRRQLGFKLTHAHRQLRQFVSFMQARRIPFITTEAALEWAMCPRSADPTYLAQRLGVVRRFARHHCAADPRTQIPPIDLLRRRPRRARPYLYSEQDIERLLSATQGLRPMGGLRRATYATLLGLLIVTGMRVSEVLALGLKDVDLHEGLLTIRKTKFGKYAGLRAMPMRAAVNCAHTANYWARAKCNSHLPRHSYRPSRNVRSLPCGRYRPALLA